MTRSHAALFSLPFLLSLSPAAVLAQSAPATAPVRAGSLHGEVADSSGAVIPGASISVTDAQGHTIATGTSGQDGSYSIANVPPGTYIVLVNAEGFGSLTSKPVAVAAGASRLFNAALDIQVQQQQVRVNADTPTVSVDPDANANSIVIKGKDLDALSDDPDELSSELTALAGPAAGPSGGQVYIDGFTGGQLPPKSAIREIRVNQNPYGAQFDKLGFGRVEVFTKPGTDKLHGQIQVQGNARQFNTGTPFVANSSNLPDYHSYQIEGTVSGPISKTASFFLSVQRRNIQDASVINAALLPGEINGDFAAGNFSNPSDFTPLTTGTNFSDAINTPTRRTNISPRLDMQLGAKNTLSVRYQYEQDGDDNQGVGQFLLRSQAYNSNESEHTIQISDTEVIGPRVIIENRFQALIDRSSQAPANVTPQVQVQGNETFGGNSEQSINDHSDHYELNTLVEMALKNHSISTGGRLRALREANAANSSFNGIFTFGSRTCPTGSTCAFADPTSNNLSAGATYAATLQGQAAGQSFTQIQADGGGPAQLVYSTGNPKASINAIDGALFYQDDWKAKPNLTLSYGLRWETQNNINHHNSWGPRLAVAYGLLHNGKPTKDVIRGGFGYFYDRFGASQVLTASRINGIVQQQFVVPNPTCYYPNGLPSAATIAATCGAPAAGSGGTAAAIYQINPELRAPSNMQASIGLDHQVNKSTTASVTYIHSHGVHALDTINANAPYAPGYNAAAGNVYQYYSEGLYNQNQLFLNFRTQVSRSLSAFGFYGLGFANADVNGVSSNPSNSQNLKQDYGRAGFDVRNRLFLLGSYSAPHYIRISPFVIAQSGNPFNFTLSQDLNGDSFFNDRPALAAAGATGSNIVKTKYGTFNESPAAGVTPVAINAGGGPALVTVNLRVGKTWGFGQRLQSEASANRQDGPPQGGPRGGGGGRGGPGGGGPGGIFGNSGSTGKRYNFTLNAQALNLFNIVNLAAPTGTIDSPNFGRSNALAGRPYSTNSASRQIFLQANLSF